MGTRRAHNAAPWLEKMAGGDLPPLAPTPSRRRSASASASRRSAGRSSGSSGKSSTPSSSGSPWDSPNWRMRPLPSTPTRTPPQPAFSPSSYRSSWYSSSSSSSGRCSRLSGSSSSRRIIPAPSTPLPVPPPSVHSWSPVPRVASAPSKVTRRRARTESMDLRFNQPEPRRHYNKLRLRASKAKGSCKFTEAGDSEISAAIGGWNTRRPKAKGKTTKAWKRSMANPLRRGMPLSDTEEE